MPLRKILLLVDLIILTVLILNFFNIITNNISNSDSLSIFDLGEDLFFLNIYSIMSLILNIIIDFFNKSNFWQTNYRLFNLLLFFTISVSIFFLDALEPLLYFWIFNLCLPFWNQESKKGDLANFKYLWEWGIS